MDLALIKKQIDDILVKENIKHVYHVDDRVNSAAKERQNLNAQFRKIEDSYKNIPALTDFLSQKNIDTTQDFEFVATEVQTMIAGFDASALLTFGKLLGFERPAQAQGDEDNDASEIHKFFGAGKFSAIEPDNAVDTITKKLLKLGDDGRILVLFDLDLSEAGGEFENNQVTGVDLLIRLKDADPNDRCLCSIFTHLVKDTDDEITRRSAIIANKPDRLTKSNLFVLAKKRKNDPQYFGDGIKKVVLTPIYETVKDASLHALEAAFKSTKTDMDKIDTYVFDHIILRASNIEGVWAGETLLRMFYILFDKNIRTEFVNTSFLSNINPLFNKAIKLAKHTFPTDFPDTPSIGRNKIRNWELYTNGNLLNPLFEPITNGDIFEIDFNGEKQYYILVGQECDIILRSYGARNRRNDFLSLLKIHFDNKDALEKKIEEFTQKYGTTNHYFSNKFLLNNYDENDPNVVGVVDFKNELLVHASILDLTSINPDGEAKFDPAFDYPVEQFSQALRKRTDFIKKICDKKIKDLAEITAELTAKGATNFDDIVNRFIETASPTTKAAGYSSPYNGHTFDFGVKRVRRQKLSWSNRLLERYGYYLSRPAELPEYAEEISVKDLTTT